MKTILSIDQGTTSSRAIVFSKNGAILCQHSKEHKQHYPTPNLVEHDANEIWQAVLDVTKKAISENENIATIGITNQRETIVCWDKNTGEPLYNALVWQDKRTAGKCDELKAEYGDVVLEKTGLPLDPYFSATKLSWLLENVLAIKKAKNENSLLCGTIDSFLLFKLTGGKVHKTDITNACRTLLYNIHDKRWDNELLKLFNIPKSILPEVVSNSELFGETAESVLPIKLPIHSLMGDQQAATVGQCCFNKGELKSTYGTGCFAMMNTGTTPQASNHGLLTTVAYQINEQTHYALEGSIFVAGSAIQWLRDNLGLIKDATETEQLAKQATDDDDVYFIPAFAGLGAPYWSSSVKASIAGMTFNTNKNVIVRATLDSICYQTNDLITAMQNDCNSAIVNLNVDGGMTNNKWFLQRMANILNIDIHRPKVVETTALGAAYMAGLACGIYKNLDDIKLNQQINNKFTPHMDKIIRSQKLKGWQFAINNSIQNTL